MKWRVLISAPYMLTVLEQYRSRLEAEGIEIITAQVRERLSERDLLSIVGTIDAVICGDDQFTERVFREAPRLKVISKWGTGIDSIDTRAAAKLGIQVCNTANAFTDAVADTALGYMLCFARQLPWMDQAMRRGLWVKPDAISLRECVLGVVGVGNIGKAVVRRARAFGMTVFGTDPASVPTSFIEETGLRMVPLVKLLEESDFVSLHCDLNATSYHLIGRNELWIMRSSAYLINTARGYVIDESALIDALGERRIAGAALDVLKRSRYPMTARFALWMAAFSHRIMPTTVSLLASESTSPPLPTCSMGFEKPVTARVARSESEGKPMSRQVFALDRKQEASQSNANNDRDWLLYRGVKNILRCDEAEVVRGIARYVISQHGSLRLLSALIERARQTPLPGVVALIGGIKSFIEPHPGGCSDGTAWVARFGNERRAIEPLLALFPELDWSELKFRWPPDAGSLALLARSLGSTARRILRLARLLERRYEFFKVLRAVELIAYYARYLSIFKGGRFRLAVTSNHSNPHGIAFNLAARKCGVPVVLITHGLPVPPVAKLSYDLAVVHCEAARQIYLEAGCRMGQVFTHGRRRQYAPMPVDSLPERLTVGIFLCKDVNEQRLRALLDRLLADRRVSRVLVRAHPTNLWVGLDSWIASRNDSRVQRSASGPVSNDLKASDIILAGNSSVLVEAVTAGRPSGYAQGLDYGSADLHGFVALGLIYPIDDKLDFDPEAMLNFYKRQGWSCVLRQFANVDEDEESVSMRVGAALRELGASRSAANITIAH